MGLHRRRLWHVTSFPAITASLGAAALAVGLVSGGLHLGSHPPAAAAPTVVTTPPPSRAAPDPTGSPAPLAVASSRAAATRVAPPAAPVRSAPPPGGPTPTPTDRRGHLGSSSGIHLPTIHLPTFG